MFIHVGLGTLSASRTSFSSLVLAAIRLSLARLSILASASQIMTTISSFSSAVRALYLSTVVFARG
jgi:hypothetical protein